MLTFLASLLCAVGILAQPAALTAPPPEPDAASAAPSAAASAAPSAPASESPNAWAAAQPADAACPAGNLLEKRKALFWEYAYNPERLTDGTAPEEGDNWKSDVTVELTTAAGHVDWDLGARTLIRGMALQGDNNDEYPVEVSDDRKTWRPAWTAPPVNGAGMRVRTTTELNAVGRYLRVGAAKGDASYSLGEVQAFCQKPAAFPAEMTRKKGVVKDENAERNKKYAHAKMDMAWLAFAVFFFVLFGRPRKQGDLLWAAGAAIACAVFVRYALVWLGAELPSTTLMPFGRGAGFRVRIEWPTVGAAVALFFAIERFDISRFRWVLAWLAGIMTVVHSILLARSLPVGQSFTSDLTTYLGAGVAVVTTGLLILAFVKRWDMGKWTERTTLATLALTAAFTWTNYGAFHGSRIIHFWDTFHYYAGSKYFKENGYTDLYYCVQWAEIDAGRQNVVKARKVRNLKTNALEDSDEIIAHPEVCRDAFTDERWKEFRSDVEYFRRNMGADWWDKMFKDHGYNASPVWNMFGQRFSNMSPASDDQIRNIAMLDLFFYVSMFVAIFWAFGLRACALALVVLGVGYPWAYYWTGGAFARVAWLWDAVLGVSFLKKRHYLLGGAALMAAALDRAFPAALFFGVGIAMVLDAVRWLRTPAGERQVEPERAFLGVRRAHWTMAIGAAVTMAIAVPLSAQQSGGMKSWAEFWDNSQKHVKTPLTNHMGLPTLYTYHPKHVARVSKNDKEEDPFKGWKDKRNSLLEDRKPFWFATIAGFMVLIGLWSRHRKEAWELSAASTLFIVGLFQLTCYYYNFVILLAPLAIARPRYVFSLIFMAFLTQYVQLQVGWFDEQYLWETVFVLVFMLYMLIDETWQARRARRVEASPEAATAEPPAETPDESQPAKTPALT